MDLGAAVDAQLVDEQPQERFRLLRVAFVDDAFEQVGDFGDKGRRRSVRRLVRRSERKLGLLREEVVEPGLEAGEPVLAAFG